MQPGAQGIAGILSFAPFILIFFVFYFLIIRPQKKRQQETVLMIEQLKKGDEVVTSGGIIGTISSLKDKRLVLKISENAKIELLKSAVVQKTDNA